MGHLCLLMQFNEIEVQTWFLLTIIALLDLNLKLKSTAELLTVTALFSKAFFIDITVLTETSSSEHNKTECLYDVTLRSMRELYEFLNVDQSELKLKFEVLWTVRDQLNTTNLHELQ